MTMSLDPLNQYPYNLDEARQSPLEICAPSIAEFDQACRQLEAGDPSSYDVLEPRYTVGRALAEEELADQLKDRILILLESGRPLPAAHISWLRHQFAHAEMAFPRRRANRPKCVKTENQKRTFAFWWINNRNQYPSDSAAFSAAAIILGSKYGTIRNWFRDDKEVAEMIAWEKEQLSTGAND